MDTDHRLDTATRRLTPEDVERMLDAGELPGDRRYELVDGALIELSAASMPHARIVASLAQSIRNHLDRHGGGVLYAGLGIVLGVPGDDRRMRAPELAFVAHATLAAAGGEAPRGFPRIVPDLVVEVVPPDDVHTDLQQKVQDYLAAGVRLVWLLHPSNRSATVFRAGGAARLLLDDDALDGGEVLPGLRLPLGEVLG